MKRRFRINANSEELGRYLGARLLGKYSAFLNVYGAEESPEYDYEESFDGSFSDCLHHLVKYQKIIDDNGLDAYLSLEPWDGGRDYQGDLTNILNDLVYEGLITQDEFDYLLYGDVSASSKVTASSFTSRKWSNATQEVLNYLSENYPDSELYKELIDKDVQISLWSDGEYSLSYNSIKNPENFLTDSAEEELVKIMKELFPDSFWGDIYDVESCSKVTASEFNHYNSYDIPETLSIYYNGELIDQCNINDMTCDNFYNLLRTDRDAATDILNYLNSLGDPVFPTAEDWNSPETNIDNIDIDELHGTFLKELYMEYADDAPISIDTGKFEIFTE